MNPPFLISTRILTSHHPPLRNSSESMAATVADSTARGVVLDLCLVLPKLVARATWWNLGHHYITPQQL